MRTFLLLLFGFFATPGTLSALTTSVMDGTITSDTLLRDSLQEIIVTAQRREALAFQTPASVDILSSKTMRLRQARTTPEALVATSGVFNQTTSRAGSPFLRGLTGNQTLLLIDGIRLNNATYRYGPNQYLNTIDPFSLDRLEVLKGGGSVGYGSDALGGVIHARTTAPTFASDKATWGSRTIGQFQTQGMEQSGRAEVQYSGKNTAFLGGVTLRNFGDLIGGDATGKQHPTGYDEYAFNGTAKFRLGNRHFLTLAHQSIEQKDQPVFHKIQLENFLRNHFSIQKRQLSYARWQHQPEGSTSRFTGTLSLQHTKEGRESQKRGSVVETLEEDRVRSVGASFQFESTPLTNLTLTTGAEAYHDLVNSTRIDRNTTSGLETPKRGLYPNGSTHFSAAAFALATWELQNWQFSSGMRYNTFSIKVRDEVNGQSILRPDALVSSFSTLYRISPANNLFASIASAFRAPNIDDLGTLGIVDFRYEVPTTNLKPESSLNTELGFRHQSERVRAELALYRNQLKDLITRVRAGTDSIAGYPVYRKENVQEGYIQGIESTLQFTWTTHLSVEGALAWQYGQNVTRDEPQRRIPPLFGRTAVQYTRNAYIITAESLFAGKQDRLAAGDKSDNRIPTGGTPGWMIVNCYGAYTFRSITVRAGFWNLLNVDYRYHGSGVNGVGRSATFGLEWKL